MLIRNYFVKKYEKLFLFQRLGSSLFHSITNEGKNKFLKRLSATLNKRTLATFQVLKGKFLGGTKQFSQSMLKLKGLQT